MKIALLGGNSYAYAFAPSYAHANGRGYIRQSDLLGAQASEIPLTPEYAYETVKDMKRRGEPVPANLQALADQHAAERGERVYSVIDKGMGLIDKGLGLFSDKKSPASTPEMGQQASDNTALIITGAVAGVAVIGVMLATGKKKGRRR